MSLQLQKETFELPEYNDSRIFNWKYFSYYLELGDYLVMNRSGDYWEVFYGTNNFVNSQRLSTGSKEFCMKSVEYQIRQDELA